MIFVYFGKSKAVKVFNDCFHWCKNVNIWSWSWVWRKVSLCQYFVFAFLASLRRFTTTSPVLEQKRSCSDHDEFEESVKSRTVSDIWNPHIGDLCWAQNLQDQQGERRILIPMDFLGDNLFAGKARRLQRSPLLSSLATAGLLWTALSPFSNSYLSQAGYCWSSMDQNRRVETLLLLAFYGPGKWKPEELQQFVNATS